MQIADIRSDGIDEVLKQADTIVIGNVAQEFCTVTENIPAGKFVVNLVRIIDRRFSAEVG